jgi:hypothetical protein
MRILNIIISAVLQYCTLCSTEGVGVLKGQTGDEGCVQQEHQIVN